MISMEDEDTDLYAAPKVAMLRWLVHLALMADICSWCSLYAVVGGVYSQAWAPLRLTNVLSRMGALASSDQSTLLFLVQVIFGGKVSTVSLTGAGACKIPPMVRL
jgi:hypothetical protein